MRQYVALVVVLLLAVIVPATVLAGNTPTPAPHTWSNGDCTLYVAPGGDDANPGSQDQPWKTIQHAADSAQPGDVVCVGAGTYTPEDDELIFLQAGTADQPITFRAAGGGEVIIQGAVLLEPSASHLRLHGFTVTGYQYWGVSIAGNEDIVLSGMEIYGGEAGINFTVTRTGDERPVKNITVEDSIIHDAIYTVVDCTPGPCDDMIFRRLDIYGGGVGEGNYGADGLAVERGKNILVEDCYVHDNSGDGIDLNSRDMMRGDDSGTIIVRRNRVESNTYNGLKLWRGGEITNNVVWNNGDTHLVIEEGSDYVVANNTFATATSHTYLITLGYDEQTGSTTVAFYNNIVYNDNPAMDGSILYISPRVTLQADYNLFYNPFREEDMLCIGDDACYSAAQINDGSYFAGSGFGEHSLYADPLFADAATGDLTLTGSSPALDAGSADYAPDDDLAGNARPQGAGPDLGAYEAGE